MNDARTAESIFFECLEAGSPEARAAFLDQACGENAELRAAVDQLVARHPDMGRFIEWAGVAEKSSETLTALPADLSATQASLIQASNTLPPNEHIGTVLANRYILQEMIGEGGMGSVYLAQQTEPVRRTVAVKLIKAGMDSRQVLARFDAERQALAMMDHPNIARVFDGGSTATGQPYFVMELVKGVPLTKYCDQHRLSVDARLELLVSVCQAVQHAHQKGIIHRDLKPGNVLVSEVDGRPTPKVIDFGVAKATEQTLTDQSFADTGVIVGTPAYMSPEQADPTSMDIDTRTDVYALGVMLYELLVGSPPIDAGQFKRGALLEMLRMVREVDPPRPSTRLSTSDALPNIAANRNIDPAKLSKLLKGELDWVVMKALEKDRTRRYETASGMARDIMRYLANEVVEARPPSTGYRLRKFVRRHRIQVTAASMVVVAFLGGMAGTSWGLVRANRARADEADQRQIAVAKQIEAEDQRSKAEASARAEAIERNKAEQAEAETLDSYRESTDEAIKQLIGSKKSLGPLERAYLEMTLKRWQAFAVRKGDGPASQAIRGEGHLRVGRLWEMLGNYDKALAEFRIAIEIRTRLSEQFPDSANYLTDLADAHNSLGVLLGRIGKYDEAVAECRAAIRVVQILTKRSPETPRYRGFLTSNHGNLGVLLGKYQKYDAACAELRLAIEIGKKLVHDFPTNDEYQRDLAFALNNLGYILGNQMGGKKNNEAAIPELQAALKLQTRLVEKFPALPTVKDLLISIHSNLGNSFTEVGNIPAAKSEYKAAGELGKTLADQYPAVVEYQIDLGGYYCNLGRLLLLENDAKEALKWLDLAVATLAPIYKNAPQNVMAKVFLYNSHRNRAMANYALGNIAAGEQDYPRAIELCPPGDREGSRAFRMARAVHLIQKGHEDLGAATFVEMSKEGDWTPQYWLTFACMMTSASGKSDKRKQEYADQAMEMLRKGVQAGLKNDAQLMKEPYLAPLRERDDFKKLIAEIKQKSGKK